MHGNHTIARAIFKAPRFISTAVIFAELRWRPWWVDLVRISLKREAAARSGGGGPWLQRLYAGVIDQLAGRQLPSVIAEHANEVGLPHYRQIFGDRALGGEDFRTYNKLLQSAAQDAWSRMWADQVCKLRYPLKDMEIDRTPTSISAQACLANVSWQRAVETADLIHIKIGMLRCGRNRDGSRTASPEAACMVCGANGGGHFTHLVECSELSQQHEAFDAAVCNGNKLQLKGRSRAEYILAAHAQDMEARITYAKCLRSAVEVRAAAGSKKNIG